MATKVVLDIFSGLENPSWELAALNEQEFFLILNALAPQQEQREEEQPPALGYRGFEIHLRENPELPELITVYDGTVRHSGEKYHDAGRQLEKWLVQTAPATVGEKVIRRILDQLSGP